MEAQQIIAKLEQIVKPYVSDPETLKNLNETTDFLVDLKINSANLVDIILDIEEAFDIIIDNGSMEKMLNIGATVAIIQTKLSEK